MPPNDEQGEGPAETDREPSNVAGHIAAITAKEQISHKIAMERVFAAQSIANTIANFLGAGDPQAKQAMNA